MINSVLRALFLAPLCGAFLLAPAHAQKTKAQLTTEVTTTFPDNTSGLITPSGVRTFQNDLISSIMPTAPVVSGNLACFNGTTGLLQDCGLSPTSLSIIVGTTTITSGANKGLLYNNAGALGNLATVNNGVAVTDSSGTPSISTTLPSALAVPSPTLSGPTITGSITATGLVKNSDLANSATTVNGQTCTLGSTCTITASAGTITSGSTTVAGSTDKFILYNNAGTLGSYAVTGTGTTAVLAASPTLTGVPVLGTPTATSLALGGAVIGTNALAVSGTTLLTGNVSLTGTVTGTYTLSGTPSIAGSAINSGTISGSYMSAVNLAAGGNGGVTGTLPVANGGTSATTAAGAATSILPTATRTGDIVYWSGSAWTTLAGNNSGTLFLQENSSGVPSWASVAGAGTMLSAQIVAGSGVSISGGCNSTTSITCTVSSAIPSPQGRLTLAANTPVMGATSCSGSPCSNQSTLRYDCYIGAGVPYYDGTNDFVDSVSSCEVTDAMVSAASAGQIVSGQVYDVFWVHGGANRICVAMSASTGGGGGWAFDTGGSNTARGTGYSQLDKSTRGYVTNKNSITNCFNGASNYGPVSANQGTYLGTIYATANGQTSYTFGSSASGGGAATFGVWNNYNRVRVGSLVQDSNPSWSQSVANTWRAADNSATFRVTFVRGDNLDSAVAEYKQASSAAGSTNSVIGIGLDTTVGFSGTTGINGSAAFTQIPPAKYDDLPGVGMHYLSANELNSTTTAITWQNTAGLAYLVNGLTVNLVQ